MGGEEIGLGDDQEVVFGEDVGLGGEFFAEEAGEEEEALVGDTIVGAARLGNAGGNSRVHVGY